MKQDLHFKNLQANDIQEDGDGEEADSKGRQMITSTLSLIVVRRLHHSTTVIYPRIYRNGKKVSRGCNLAILTITVSVVGQ